MNTSITHETAAELLDMFQLPSNDAQAALQLLAEGDSKLLRDLKLNVKSILSGDHLSVKERALTALSCAANENNRVLISYFTAEAKAAGASETELGDAVACAAMLSSNNVLYRFRHFSKKEKYDQLPARIRMSAMMAPSCGKEVFELMSLAISAMNGCEMCVNAHEHSLMELGTSEERVFEAIRIASIIAGTTKLFN